MSLVLVQDNPEPHWMNKKNTAKSLGISVQAFEKWGVKPVGKVGRSVYFTMADVLENRRQNEEAKRQPASPDVDPDSPGVNLDRERYRLTKAQADAQELKNEVNRQEVVPVDFATYALAKVAAEASGVLDGLPLNLVRKHPELTTIQRENIKRELSKAMNSLSKLSQGIADYLDDYIRETAS